MIGDLLLYQRDGLYDKGIEWLTRSKWTHAAQDIGDGMLIESYPGIGVRQRIYMDNEPDMGRFRVKDSNPDIYKLHLSWLFDQIGKDYNWPGIFGFALNDVDLSNPLKWFCSSLVITYQEMCGYVLIKKDERLVAPGDLADSPLLIQLDVNEE